MKEAQYWTIQSANHLSWEAIALAMVVCVPQLSTMKPMASEEIFVMNSVFPNTKTYASRKKKKYMQAEDTSLSPFPIPETQERTKIAVTNIAANSHVTAD